MGGMVSVLLISLTACPQDARIEEPSVDAGFDALVPVPPEAGGGFTGTPEALDIMTWNLQDFPKKGTETIEKVAEILQDVQPDIVAVQEIVDGHALIALAESIGWEANVTEFYEPGEYYNPPVGMMWNKKYVQVRSQQVILEGDSLAFPRAPLLFEFTWRGVDLVVINVHLKALGDNVINWNDPWDHEMRRISACEKLEEYIRTFHPNEKVVLLGDFNDRIDEPVETNVFMAFLSKKHLYMFADMYIAMGIESVPSYPTWRSHIDHILITSELFPHYYRAGSWTSTILADGYFSSWSWYDATVTDHRPVMMHLDMKNELSSQAE